MINEDKVKPDNYFFLEDVTNTDVIISDTTKETKPLYKNGIIILYSNVSFVEYKEYLDQDYKKQNENNITLDVYHKSGKFQLVDDSARYFIEDYTKWLNSL